MQKKKKNDIRCPNPEYCSAGEPFLQPLPNPEDKIPNEFFPKLEDNETIYRCSYCGFVWVQSNEFRIGKNVKPLGVYKNGKFSVKRDNPLNT
jgi:DNA-directed RNA polymerase subunit RPC12/RpoP